LSQVTLARAPEICSWPRMLNTSVKRASESAGIVTVAELPRLVPPAVVTAMLQLVACLARLATARSVSREPSRPMPWRYAVVLAATMLSSEITGRLAPSALRLALPTGMTRALTKSWGAPVISNRPTWPVGARSVTSDVVSPLTVMPV
jgi:hypothetical protein